MPTPEQALSVQDSAVRRINYAVELGNALYDSMRDWRIAQPLDVDVEVKPDGMGWWVTVTKLDPVPDLEQWGLVFGSVAHHFRSTLNTMLSRIAEVEGANDNKALQFPIVTDRKAWHGANGAERRQIGMLPERVRRAIYALQPFVLAAGYQGDPINDILAVLAWTDNQDKHRAELTGMLTPAFFKHDYRPVYVDRDANLARPPIAYTHDFSLKVGSRLIDADTAPYRIAEVAHGTLDLTMDIGFLDEKGAITPVRRALDEFRSQVSHVLEVVLLVWENPGFDVDRLAGSKDFRQGAAFGKAAVNSLYGGGTWEKDFVNTARWEEQQASYKLKRLIDEVKRVYPEGN